MGPSLSEFLVLTDDAIGMDAADAGVLLAEVVPG
jgi:hypothetical protein